MAWAYRLGRPINRASGHVGLQEVALAQKNAGCEDEKPHYARKIDRPHRLTRRFRLELFSE